MRNTILLIISLLAGTAFATCYSSDFEDSHPCRENRTGYPLTYSDGSSLEVGRVSCFTGYSKYMISEYGKVKGIPVAFKVKHIPCKTITRIVKTKSGTRYFTDLHGNRKIDDEYDVYYSDSTDYREDKFSDIKVELHLNLNVFYDDGIIELYRDDGSLRYKGKLKIEPDESHISTSGDCYNKKGKVTRHTNNADLCQ